jgi:hypothetical protein
MLDNHLEGNMVIDNRSILHIGHWVRMVPILPRSLHGKEALTLGSQAGFFLAGCYYGRMTQPVAQHF